MARTDRKLVRQGWLLLLCLALVPRPAAAQDHYPRTPGYDVRHYRFALTLADQTDEISGETTVTVRFRTSGLTSLSLDLVGKPAGRAGGTTGMTVTSVSRGGQSLPFEHTADRLTWQLPAPSQADSTATYRIVYQGIPEDGLIISRNRHGDRTFFGDNWPNRAHYWLPTRDHPSDKATCEFVVTAPDPYRVVANGRLFEEKNLPSNQRLTHWRTDVPIPTKVMVMGAARFAVRQAGQVAGKPVQSWVYPQDSIAGFSDYRVAPRVLAWMQDKIGPYAFEKLANVQSTTRYGGMENASCIFYAENSVTGRGEAEDLIAHEVAHQWFGDAATEQDWYHVWLSEGFATYLTECYNEATYGRARLVKNMRAARVRTLAYYQTSPQSPIVDTTIQELTKLLSPNVYQKAAWFLHMLRHRVGDEAFWRSLRAYYARYRDGNALTDDFRREVERESGTDLAAFFRQWLYQPGQPALEGTWQYARQKLTITMRQTQPGTFQFPLEVGTYDAAGKLLKKFTLHVTQREQTFTLPLASVPATLQPDPDTWLLMTGTLVRQP